MDKVYAFLYPRIFLGETTFGHLLYLLYPYLPKFSNQILSKDKRLSVHPAIAKETLGTHIIQLPPGVFISPRDVVAVLYLLYGIDPRTGIAIHHSIYGVFIAYILAIEDISLLYELGSGSLTDFRYLLFRFPWFI